jgi:predicted HicB family RNase H-like nuclease
MKRVPPVKSSDISKANEKRFIEGKGNKHPWDEGDERVIKAFNLRLPEPLHMKLQFIAEHTPNSIHSFIMEAVEEAVERALEDLIRK